MARYLGKLSGIGPVFGAGLLALSLLGGCATSGSGDFDKNAPVFTKHYDDTAPLNAVDSLLFAYRAKDYIGVYYLTKPADAQSAADRKAFLAEVESGDEWTPALWQLETKVAYTGEKTSADVVGSILSDLDGFLYTDTMRFYCFLDGEHWKIARHAFEGDSVLLGPVETKQREP